MGQLLRAESEGLKSMKGPNSYDHGYRLFINYKFINKIVLLHSQSSYMQTMKKKIKIDDRLF